MIQRTVTALVGAVLFIAFLIIGGWPLDLWVGTLTTVGIYEFLKIKRLTLLSLEGILSLLAGLSIAVPAIARGLNMSADGPYLLFALCVFIMLAATIFSKGKYNFEDVSFPFLASFYVGLGFQGLILARETSLFIVFFAVFIVWADDIGAYLVGSQVGRHKLLPSISPNKTVEGAIGGILGALLIAGILWIIFQKQVGQITLGRLLLYALAFSIVAQIGDLIESAFKRHYGVKDSGKLLPGHGGILDRFDSMLLVLPVMHIFGLF